MSLNSPSKNERIERHLMRQRGAGARTINADFGFSFAGFSAPNSQEATPTAVLSKPSPKRRKIIAEDKGVEQEVATSSALDRRGRTKASRMKRRFVMDADDQPTKSKDEESGDGEDSFVKRVGPKRRNGKDQQESREIQEEQAAYEPSETGPKAKSTRSMNATKRGKRAKEAQDVDATAMKTEEQTETIEQAPGRRKRAPARKVASATVRDEGTAGKDEEFPGVSPAQNAEFKARSRKAGANDTGKLAVPSGTSDRDGASKVGPEVARKKSQRTRKAIKEEEGDEQRKSQDERSGSDENKRPANVDSVPRRKPISKSKAAKNQTLAATPPQLERRPLQEADTNRSPSPRKSPEKEQKDVKLQTPPKVTSSKRKRNEVVETNAQGQDCPRKSRKLKVQRDGDQAPEQGRSTVSALKKDPEKPDMEVFPSVAAAKDEESKQQNLKKPTRSDRPKKTAEASRSSNQQAAQFTSTENEACDEDVDWLFAAPDARPRSATTKSLAGKASAPKQKAKLPDIDLDDLIANVALFAQTSGPQSSKPGAGGGLGGTVRRGRKR